MCELIETEPHPQVQLECQVPEMQEQDDGIGGL